MSTLAENSVRIKLEKVTFDTDQGILQNEEQRWGLALKDVYKLGLNLYKETVGKVLHLSYEDKLRLVAYTQQAMHGSFNEETAPPLGVLDVIGRDRRQAWIQLGDISQVQAMAGYLHMLDRLCPLFKPYVEAYQVDSEDKNLQKKAEEEECKARQELQNRAEVEQKKSQQKEPTEEDHVRGIKDALNAQTYEQFLQYSQQQYPGNYDQQAILIRQLQEQHYHQYMQQLAIDQRLANKAIGDQADTFEEKQNADQIERENKDGIIHTKDSGVMTNIKSYMEENELRSPGDANESQPGSQPEDSEDEDGDGFPKIEPPNMWTRPDVANFKVTVRKSADGRGMLQVGHGEAVTIRVPTHEGGKCLFWEFATDHYDIGFGVLFEWSKPISPQVTVHCSESEEEEDDDDDATAEGNDEFDVEGTSTPTAKMLRPPMSAVIPVYRRDSHQEVYAGSHTYPGEGVYLLKFDNTYSLWRSKTLYYRVYYTRR